MSAQGLARMRLLLRQPWVAQIPAPSLRPHAARLPALDA